jgi:NTP pyrophosphatase (non-canonical NTP hydrolase)
MKLTDMFPRTRFVDEFSFDRQLEVVVGEIDEIRDAVVRGTNVDEEIFDVLHAATQLLYMRGLTESQINDYSAQIREKNDRRGYYGSDN